MSKVILVASGKGGTGKTMFSVNLGCAISSFGHNVVIVDMDMGMRNLDMYLGLEGQVVYDTYDALKGICRTKQAIVKDDKFKNVSIMAASPLDEREKVSPLDVRRLFSELKSKFDYIIIDGPPGIGEDLNLASTSVDTGIVILTPDYAAIRDADSVDSFLRNKRIRNRYYVVNKAVLDLERRGLEVKLEEIDTIMKSKPLGAIAYDENIHISTNMGIPIVSKTDAYIAKNFLKIAKRVIDE